MFNSSEGGKTLYERSIDREQDVEIVKEVQNLRRPTSGSNETRVDSPSSPVCLSSAFEIDRRVVQRNYEICHAKGEERANI